MEILRRGSIVVIGIAVEDSFDRLSTVVPEAWSRLWARLDQISGRTSDTDTFVEISFALDGGRYREVVGAEVEPGAMPPEGMVKIELPEAIYARTLHDGPLPGIARTFGALQAFARDQGREPDGVLVDSGYAPDGERPHELFVRLR